MFKRNSMGVWGKFQSCFKDDGGVFLETFKGASQFKRSSKGVSRKFQDIFKEVLRKFQGCLEKVSSFKGVSRMFQWSFVLGLFCCCTDLIVATRAEGGLVVFSLHPAVCLFVPDKRTNFLFILYFKYWIPSSINMCCMGYFSNYDKIWHPVFPR